MRLDKYKCGIQCMPHFNWGDSSTTVNNQYGHTKSKLEFKQSNQYKAKVETS